ncbi:MAG: bifunctional O-acetylhomoserine aminocarboxypropyltransferase/cysteine synthase [Erysipelotrichaceae bacterium]|nr:bifunctional O-acetylhomoserine aminocarboxypropyltransferase/cysteine synthase [Erysipelotrichaceae bacterium]MCI9523656.1 bifunctional O-acetylhomoserine aminocarboxypropyltransferase/cysteine synthase [Erysipelotrichaceae bacterium]
MNVETKCLHAGYEPKNGEPRTLPIYQSTTYKYDSTEYVGQLFDLSVEGHMYSRISNPTVEAVEKKIAALEGGVGALCTTSGQAATFIALLNLLKSGDHFVSSSTIYGGTINLFSITLKKFGIDVTFVDPDASKEELHKAFRENTKAMFGEIMANPAMNVLDVEKFAEIAHAHDVPLIIDNTFATPYLCRPFDFGADIIIHSTTKYMDGHALQPGGVIVDSGKFNWNNGRFPGLTTPDESYHGIVYTESFKESAYITKARVQLMRDLGCYPSAHAAFLLNLGLETLAVRMDKHCANAQKVAEFLKEQPDVEFIHYPGLFDDPYHALKEKYLPNGCSGVISFSIKGGRERAAAFIDHLKLVSLEVHVADIRTCVLHPATSTHRQLSDEQLIQAGITPGLIRLSCGIEHVDDILEDLKGAFAKIA